MTVYVEKKEEEQANKSCTRKDATVERKLAISLNE
jgi:hypothetical protein